MFKMAIMTGSRSKLTSLFLESLFQPVAGYTPQHLDRKWGGNFHHSEEFTSKTMQQWRFYLRNWIIKQGDLDGTIGIWPAKLGCCSSCGPWMNLVQPDRFAERFVAEVSAEKYRLWSAEKYRLWSLWRLRALWRLCGSAQLPWSWWVKYPMVPMVI